MKYEFDMSVSGIGELDGEVVCHTYIPVSAPDRNVLVSEYEYTGDMTCTWLVILRHTPMEDEDFYEASVWPLSDDLSTAYDTPMFSGCGDTDNGSQIMYDTYVNQCTRGDIMDM